jgi:glycerate-2-kinase
MGLAGGVPETPKLLPESVRNLVIGNNARALQAAAVKAVTLGYRVLNLGSYVDGETREVAAVTAGVIESIQADSLPLAPPACVLIGGETTVTLGDRPGLGGRNQEFALAAALKLRDAGLENVVLLSGGTDGEDGPTDVAGASADVGTMQRAAGLGLDPREFLARHDAYHFFESAGGLIRTGLTGTNVMDVRIALIGTPRAS